MLGRQRLLDGGFALLLLSLAVLAGYGLLAPAVLAATPLAGPARAVGILAPPRLGPGPVAVADLSRPAVDDFLGPAEREAAAPPPRWPKRFSGRVLDEGRAPLAGASVVVDGTEHRTDAAGRFTLEDITPDARLLVKLPGYAKATLRPTPTIVEVALRRHAVKAAYLTYYGVGDRAIRARVLDLAARTELNAVVIDVKGDRGWIVYPTEVELAIAAGARGPSTLRDFDALMADLKLRGVYTIARIVVFKDNVLAHHKPEWAVKDTRTGRAWADNEKLAWVDPFREEVWDYNLAIAREAVRKGFDEVQFDYVRFPTDGRLAAAAYARPNTRATRLPTIAGFLERARRELGALGAFVAADIFGYTAFNENDTDIGQRVEELAPHLDYLCPMVYPSGYHRGIPGYPNPVEHPYRVVHESVRLIRKRAAPAPARVRPWLQDFRDYAFDRRVFGAPEIRAQIRAAGDAGAIGWMLWNPRNEYTAAALSAKGSAPAR